MAGTLSLPVIDLFSPDRAAAAKSIRQACLEHGFFYVINHGVEDALFQQVFHESKKFFSLPLDEKMKLQRNKDHRGYTPLYAETLDPSSKFKGDLKESFYIGPAGSDQSQMNMNQWPSEGNYRSFAIMESYNGSLLWKSSTISILYKGCLRPPTWGLHRAVGESLLSLIAVALDLDDQFFQKIGALHEPMGFVRLLHYRGELTDPDIGNYGASAHSDYGMITLLATDGVRGLQICREKNRQPNLWEDVPHVNGAFIVNVGDMLERWTNCLFRSTLHRVLATGQERYSVAFFLDPNSDCLVECLESCCSESSPPRFPPIRSGDYIQERLRVTYSLN